MLLTVTEQGAAFARDWTASYELAAEELFQPLTAQQLTTLADILRTLSAHATSAVDA